MDNLRSSDISLFVTVLNDLILHLYSNFHLVHNYVIFGKYNYKYVDMRK